MKPTLSERLLERIDAGSFYSRYTRLVHLDGKPEAKGLCPLHEEKTPSFFVNLKTGSFKCFGCGAGGGPLQFYAALYRLSIWEASSELRQKFGLGNGFRDYSDHRRTVSAGKGRVKTPGSRAHKGAKVTESRAPAGRLGADSKGLREDPAHLQAEFESELAGSGVASPSGSEAAVSPTPRPSDRNGTDPGAPSRSKPESDLESGGSSPGAVTGDGEMAWAGDYESALAGPPISPFSDSPSLDA